MGTKTVRELIIKRILYFIYSSSKCNSLHLAYEYLLHLRTGYLSKFLTFK